jgi:predicted transposase/invertase (TIGR01784 family)
MYFVCPKPNRGMIMNRNEFFAMVKDVHEHPEHLAEYRKTYRNVYPFSDGIFKMLIANEAKPERTVKFLNAMLELTGGNAIKSFTLGVQENPGVLNDKTAIFDIYGTTEAGAPILIEVQQNYNKFFVDRLIYYTSRVFTRTVKKSQTYRLPHIYVLSILTENQFPLERNTYLHHSQLVRNRHHFYDKLDVYLIELEKFFAIEDRTPLEVREQSTRADMLRIFRDVLEEKDIPEEKLKSLLDKDFIKDVSLTGYTDEILLNEVDGMTDLLYERQGAYAQGHDDACKEHAQLMVDAGILTPEKAAELFKVPKKEILPRNR